MSSFCVRNVFICSLLLLLQSCRSDIDVVFNSTSSGSNNEIFPTVFPLIFQQKLRAPNAEIGNWERFGSSTILDAQGTKLLACAWSDHHSSFTEPGSARVFDFNGTTKKWEQTSFLTASDAFSYGKLGTHCALSKTNSVIALFGENYRNINTYQTGALYLYWDDGGGIIQKQKIAADDINFDDKAKFGSYPSFSRDAKSLVFSAPNKDETIVNGGAVYYYEFNSSTSLYEFKQKILAPAFASSMENFGGRLLLSDDSNTLAISQLSYDLDYTDEGIVYIYKKDSGGLFTLHHEIHPSNKETNLKFGLSLAFNKDSSRLAIGAKKYQGIYHVGSVYVFSLEGDKYVEKQLLDAPDVSLNGTTFFGIQLSFNSIGNTLYISSSEYKPDVNIDGMVYRYISGGKSWKLDQRITTNAVGTTSSGLGSGLSSNDAGDILAVGAQRISNLVSDSNSGAAYIYKSDPLEGKSFANSSIASVLTSSSGLINHLLDLEFDYSDTGNLPLSFTSNSDVSFVTKSLTSTLQLNSQNSYVQFSNITFTDPVSISLSVFPEATLQANQVIFDSQTFSLRTGANATQLVFEVYRNSGANVSTWQTDAKTFHEGRWHHITVKFDDSTNLPEIYVNGEIAIITQLALAGGTLDSSTSFSLGKTTGTTSLAGYYRDLLIINKMLNLDEILSIHRISRK